MKFPGLSVQGSAGLVDQADKFTWKPERAVMFPKYQKSAQQELNLLEFHGGGTRGWVAKTAQPRLVWKGEGGKDQPLKTSLMT